MWSMSPPRASVIALVGVPGSSDLPPHGASFCGSPRLLWTNKFVGSSSIKCEEAANGASKTTAPMAKDAEFRILEALQFAFGCSTPTIYIIQSDEVVHRPKNFRFWPTTSVR